MNSIRKNLLDLKHSIYQTKGALFFSIGMGGWIAISLGATQLGVKFPTAFAIGGIFSIMFLYNSLKLFERCSEIREEIENSLPKSLKENPINNPKKIKLNINKNISSKN